jgi:hypothetical protein
MTVVEEIIPTLRELNCTDKLRVLYILMVELARAEGALTIDESAIAGRTFEIWSPQASAGAAEALLSALQAEGGNA